MVSNTFLLNPSLGASAKLLLVADHDEDVCE